MDETDISEKKSYISGHVLVNANLQFKLLILSLNIFTTSLKKWDYKSLSWK